MSTMVFGTAVGPALSGTLIDADLSFPEQAPWIAAYMVAATVLLSFAILAQRHRLPTLVLDPR